MITDIVELDRNSVVTPFGLRFWDSLTNGIVSDGLVVTAYAPGHPNRSRQAFPNPTGTFAVQHVPGLRALEAGTGDADFWAGLPIPQPLTIEVRDIQRRFSSFSLRTFAPQRDPLVWTELSSLSPPASPYSAATWVPLFSAPTRLVPGGVGAIRAQLFDPDLDGPAAWAVVEVVVPGLGPVRSIADAAGTIAILFGYPTPPVESLASLASSPLSPLAAPLSVRLTDQTWTLPLRVAYDHLTVAPGSLPDLDEVMAQPEALMWADLARTRELTEAHLQFGEEAVLRTVDDAGLTRPSVVHVQAGTPH